MEQGAARPAVLDASTASAAAEVPDAAPGLCATRETAAGAPGAEAREDSDEEAMLLAAAPGSAPPVAATTAPVRFFSPALAEGCVLLFLVAGIWVGAGELAQYIFQDLGLREPNFLTYINVSSSQSENFNGKRCIRTQHSKCRILNWNCMLFIPGANFVASCALFSTFFLTLMCTAHRPCSKTLLMRLHVRAIKSTLEAGTMQLHSKSSGIHVI